MHSLSFQIMPHLSTAWVSRCLVSKRAELGDCTISSLLISIRPSIHLVRSFLRDYFPFVSSFVIPPPALMSRHPASASRRNKRGVGKYPLLCLFFLFLPETPSSIMKENSNQ
ncbi:hypothetical protein FJTKL_12408 [Diaporthe vaccinii]|uniref:Uncharacterized protein n=1 Tax=Diaporthe vaccinii TaxID=105482 RepID=A0ABR4EE19_9PEZI